MISNEQQTLLIVDERYDYLSLIEIILESEFYVKIVKANSNLEAKGILKNNPAINAIISGPHPFETTSEDNYYLYNLCHEKIPFICYCPELNDSEIEKLKNDNSSNIHLKNPLDETRLYGTLQGLLGLQGHSYTIEDRKGEETALKCIKLSTLRMFSKLSYDLYLKLGGDKFIQVGSQGNDDLNSLIEHYTTKGIDYLYLRENDYLSYLETAKDIIATNTKDRIDTGKQKYTTVQIYDLAFEVSREHLKSLGVTRIQEELVHEAMENLIVDLKEDKILYSMIKDFYSDKNYLTNHSLLIIYLSSMIISKMGWSNNQTLQQLIYAGFFHDMFIPEEFAMLQDLDSLDSEADKAKVLKHLKKAAEVMEGIKGINNDAHKMITDHHERPDGSGYPMRLTATQLPPLSCAFITAHYIIDHLYEENFNSVNLASLIQSMQGVWDQGNFKRVYSCTRALLLD